MIQNKNDVYSGSHYSPPPLCIEPEQLDAIIRITDGIKKNIHLHPQQDEGIHIIDIRKTWEKTVRVGTELAMADFRKRRIEFEKDMDDKGLSS